MLSQVVSQKKSLIHVINPDFFLVLIEKVDIAIVLDSVFEI